MSIAAHERKACHRTDLTNTSLAEPIGPFESCFDPKKIVSLDPWGHMVAEVFADKLLAGWDIRPTIAVTKAHVQMPEIKDAIVAGRLKPDNDLLTSAGDVRVTKAAVEPVWWLPGIAERFGVKEVDLRRTLFEHTGGMYTELVTRPDLELFLPPIGGATIYFFGDVSKLGKPGTKIAFRLHAELPRAQPRVERNPRRGGVFFAAKTPPADRAKLKGRVLNECLKWTAGFQPAS